MFYNLNMYKKKIETPKEQKHKSMYAIVAANFLE